MVHLGETEGEIWRQKATDLISMTPGTSIKSTGEERPVEDHLSA